MSNVDTSTARQQAQAMREAAGQRLGIEAGWLKGKADLIDALLAERDALRAQVGAMALEVSAIADSNRAAQGYLDEACAALATARREAAAEMRKRMADHVAECMATLGLPIGVDSLRALPLPGDVS